MIKVTRLNGEVMYLNYVQILYLESIPETKIMMMNGRYYLVQDSIESICEQVRTLLGDLVWFQNKAIGGGLTDSEPSEQEKPRTTNL